MAAFRLRPSWLALLFLPAVLLGREQVPLAAAQAPGSAAEHPARYPFDPVCPWGRLSDGHGLLLRCLERTEAQALSAAAPGTSAAPAAIAAVPTSAVPDAARNPAPSSAEGTPQALSGRNPALPAPTPPRSAKLYRKVSVKEVGTAQADTGELPEAQPQLRKVADRYAQCVGNNGGLEGEQGKVTLRFLVRERGRAEGVSVKERHGVSLAAAKCVAEVVDRRYVGYPGAPIVGATLSIEFMPEGAAR
jgi:hypothetical protein